MSSLLNALAISSSGMEAQATRLRHVSENIANADTPGYRRKIASFESVANFGSDIGQVRSGPVQLDQSTREMVFDPAHPLADATGHYEGSNVDLIVEVADARQAQRSYEANLKMFDQARQMTSSVLELLRR
ncbi:flagellar basal body rod protein FlgC [Tropicimonas sediminicola]|uniref:Flagellar basal-body rod protein FlgC n=1 Tax=Tropicimonas sediminicola TaxID=1031541 RepID=A0A239JC96_9RHOB|nr:flagellar basal body rod protein FlgC [Tropicimonas sediminicola]SNT03429.1 flagellar basal-body rod protein FlgC [Tropicimonas sediminicola]